MNCLHSLAPTWQQLLIPKGKAGRCAPLPQLLLPLLGRFCLVAVAVLGTSIHFLAWESPSQLGNLKITWAVATKSQVPMFPSRLGKRTGAPGVGNVRCHGQDEFEVSQAVAVKAHAWCHNARHHDITAWGARWALPWSWAGSYLFPFLKSLPPSPAAWFYCLLTWNSEGFECLQGRQRLSRCQVHVSHKQSWVTELCREYVFLAIFFSTYLLLWSHTFLSSIHAVEYTLSVPLAFLWYKTSWVT